MTDDAAENGATGRHAGETAVTVTIRGQRLPAAVAQEAAIARLEHQAYMTDDEFDLAFADLQTALATRLDVPVGTALGRVLRAAIAIFNTGRLHQASRLCRFVETSLETHTAHPDERTEVRASIDESAVNEGLLGKYLADPEARADAAAVVRSLGYLQPGVALDALAKEKRRDRRRLLLNAVESFGAAAFPEVFSHLTAPSAATQPWYVTRNLLFLISRLELPYGTRERGTIEPIGRYVTHDLAPLRAAATAALRHIGGREIIPFVIRALEPFSYAPGSIDDTDALKRQLLLVMETLVETGNDTAIAVVAEVATGARASEFDLGHALRDEACVALARRREPLPRRAALVIVAELDHMLKKRLKLVTEKVALGIDAHACHALSALIADSEEPEAREVLARPVLQKVLHHATAAAG